jgi:hypothetical protein
MTAVASLCFLFFSLAVDRCSCAGISCHAQPNISSKHRKKKKRRMEWMQSSGDLCRYFSHCFYDGGSSFFAALVVLPSSSRPPFLPLY